MSACLYVYADKFTACVQNVRLLNACTHALSFTRHWSVDVSMTSCSMLLQTFSRHCRSSCVHSEGGNFEHMLKIYLLRHTNKQITFPVDIY